MKSYEEMNHRFHWLLKSIENNNKLYFQQNDSIYKSYSIIKVKGAYTIKVFASLPKSIIVLIESAFLDSYEYTANT